MCDCPRCDAQKKVLGEAGEGGGPGTALSSGQFERKVAYAKPKGS